MGSEERKINMKKLMFAACGLLCAVAMVLATACSEADGPKPADLAAQAAKAYYDELLHGQVEAFVDGHYQPDSIPSGYREQLIANARMYVGQQKEEHAGIRGVSIAHATADTVRHVASVFLVLNYGDHSSEQIVVPMVERHHVWYMK